MHALQVNYQFVSRQPQCHYFFDNKKMLVKFVKNKKRGRFAVVVAAKVDGQIKIGWSMCCKLDKFDRVEGVKAAVKRLSTDNSGAPRKLNEEIEHMFHRATAYFKT